MEILTDIPFELDSDALAKYLRIKPDTEDAREFGDFLDKARAVGRPKAVFMECYVEGRGDDSVNIAGVTFTSRALRANLDRVERVFPYVATCGDELAGLDIPADDIIKRFWLDTIQGTLLSFSTSHLKAHLTGKYRLGKTATMSPGSGDVMVWPIEQQRELFSLLGDVKSLIGVELTDSCFMLPIKSVSGIRFPTEVGFESCQLCHREDCPSRSAPFDRQLWHSIQDGLKPET
ncbi:MAG: vitamin B12 dependent methionine synthase [Candidatus Eisenbacteria bacterium]